MNKWWNNLWHFLDRWIIFNTFSLHRINCISVKTAMTKNDAYNGSWKGSGGMGICFGLETPTSFGQTPSFPHNTCMLASLQHKECKYGPTFTFKTRHSCMDRWCSKMPFIFHIYLLILLLRSEVWQIANVLSTSRWVLWSLYKSGDSSGGLASLWIRGFCSLWSQGYGRAGVQGRVQGTA